MIKVIPFVIVSILATGCMNIIEMPKEKVSVNIIPEELKTAGVIGDYTIVKTPKGLETTYSESTVPLGEYSSLCGSRVRISSQEKVAEIRTHISILENDSRAKQLFDSLNMEIIQTQT